MSNGVTYTTVDLNATGATTVFAPSHDATVHGVHLTNGGSTAVVQLEITDGTDTVVLTPGQSAGGNIDVDRPLPLDGDNALQINVTTAEGSALTATAAVPVGD